MPWHLGMPVEVLAGDGEFSEVLTMEARYVEAGSMTIFWTQNRALKTTSLARVPIRT